MAWFARALGSIIVVCAVSAPAVVSGQEMEEEEGVAVAESPMDPDAVRWGAGVRIRYVFMPTAIQNLFLDHSQPMSNVGFGLEAVRRKGSFDIVFGLEYENVSPRDGYYLEKGSEGRLTPDYLGLVEFDGLAILGLDASFIWHTRITDILDFRYGAGLGLAFVLGDVLKADAMCQPGTPKSELDNKDTTQCGPVEPLAVQDDVPPVVPIVNVLLGLRITPAPDVGINIEGGFRDVFFVGVSSTYVF